MPIDMITIATSASHYLPPSYISFAIIIFSSIFNIKIFNVS